MIGQDRPRITIVIPTLNRGHSVGKAVESALAQTRRDVEILVSDNGSTDGTRQVLDGFADPRLRVMRHDRTVPATKHANFLLDQARGEYFVGLSDDDYLEPDFCTCVLDLFDRKANVAFVYTGCVLHYAQVRVPSKVGPAVESGVDFLEAFYGGQRDVCWCGCATRTADLRAIGPLPDKQICGDMFYWTKLAFQGDVGCVRKRVAHYTLVAENTSGGTPVLAWTAEAQATAADVLERLRATAGAARTARIRHRVTRFLARDCANQFAWNAMRGMNKAGLLQALPAAAPILLGDPRVWPRVAAALALPPTVIRTAILAFARRRSTATCAE